MLAVIACLLGIFALLIIAELLGKNKILKGEFHRKFLHITAGSFIAFWPWLISWRSIQLIGVAMLAVMLANRYYGFLNYRGRVGRASYGDIFLALAILICALIAHNKLFFALAILQVSLADGLAAVIGIRYGLRWSYKVFGHRKTLVGSLVFWIISLDILGPGLLADPNLFSFHNYYTLLLVLPPVFTLAENLSVFGLDNLIIPLLTVVILRAAQV